MATFPETSSKIGAPDGSKIPTPSKPQPQPTTGRP
jgi:hypothetical protein